MENSKNIKLINEKSPNSQSKRKGKAKNKNKVVKKTNPIEKSSDAGETTVKDAAVEDPKALNEADLKNAKKIAKKLRQKQKKILRNEANSEKKEAKSANDNSQEELPKKNPAATIFVGNLPVNTKRVQLVKLLKDYGPVHSIRFRTAGGKEFKYNKQRKKAGTLIAYVVLKDEETANRALTLNGTEFKSNHLRITKADKKPNSTGEVDSKQMVFIGNLKNSTTEEDLREIFSSCGEIEYVRCIHDGDKGCKGVAYVCFKNPEAVGLALELNETLLYERPIRVERYSVKKLGAKQARDAAATKTKKPVMGARKRLDTKKNKDGNKPNKSNDGDVKKKKSEFRGVKIDNIKKKQKNKKPSKQLMQLAKKIAPK